MKIGEFSPGLVKLKKNQSCFDKDWSNEGGDSELVSLEDIEINDLKGKILIEKSEAWNGKKNNEFWYPNVYCVSNFDYAFVITFYERKLDIKNRQTHIGILETLEF